MIAPAKKLGPRFSLGQTVMTPGAIEAFQTNDQLPIELLKRHIKGDWGEVCKDDSEANEQALEHGSRIMSVYFLKDQTKIWIITEADRSATTLLLPSEY
jgi:hypothetical protein